MRFLSAIPAYGRDYPSRKAVLAAWKEGKDFLIQDYKESGYISIKELEPGVTLNIRYKKLTMVCPVTGAVTKGKK
jgi:hypothetical protein